MDERKEYVSFTIPRREAQPAPMARIHNPIGPVKVDFSTAASFAEIEYGPPAGGALPAAPAQPIGPRTVDPIREKFFNMRRLASGISFARNDPVLFHKQAKFMEDFSDEYSGGAQFFMYYPCYQHMGYEQLRTYFTWRTKVRRGQIPPVSLSYVYLYIYELLSGIGQETFAHGLANLMALWEAYREREPSLDRYLPGWLKDYHIYYPLPHNFEGFATERGLKGYYPDLFLSGAEAAGSLALWNGLSSYDVTKSKFYSDGNAALMADCFDAVLGGIGELCAGHGCAVEDLLLCGSHEGLPWYPFQRALFYPWLKQPDRQVSIRGREIYSCINNRWTVNMSVPYWRRRDLAGYLLKKTEVCLRQAVKYKFKLTANPSAFSPSLQRLKALGIPLAAFDAAIEKSVALFHKGLTRTVVIVNHDNLARIRQEALGTQDKLIVPEEPLSPAPAVKPAEQHDPPDAQQDGWTAFKDALNPMERKALFLILGGADIKAFAGANGIMLEVLADNINEKAADYLGDNLMESQEPEGVPMIYCEYRAKVAEMVG